METCPYKYECTEKILSKLVEGSMGVYWSENQAMKMLKTLITLSGGNDV